MEQMTEFLGIDEPNTDNPTEEHAETPQPQEAEDPATTGDQLQTLAAENEKLRHEIAVHKAIADAGLSPAANAIAAEILAVIPIDQVDDMAHKLSQLTANRKPPSDLPITALRPGSGIEPPSQRQSTTWGDVLMTTRNVNNVH
ncbi:hypothetical protein FRC0191_01882 [Corynebacterium diphtheriae]|uniref:hypothetical protein n=1 Tax=Corynebacterium diphtheriae TaxID=1717 RepID=UPI0013C6E657|nr:hypothetical protein [Corynebacterium diphtheriae]MBG9306409.1 hypothetical protein [Corynebacterium diphtheriae bv. mitis]CAB0812171.1 hypothetical protein FRC0191_01882 [Corynebacterium diphtheriae]